MKLFRDFGILPSNLVELGAYALQSDPNFSKTYTRSIVSLKRMVEMYTGKIVDKNKAQTSNWEEMPLSTQQLDYAANDAYCALIVFNKLSNIVSICGAILNPPKYTSNLKADYDAGKLLGSKTISRIAERTTSSTSTSATTPSQGPSSASTRTYDEDMPRPGNPPRPQHLRAYKLWHNQQMTLQQICSSLRSRDNPLAESTVISYVVRALQADPTLPFSKENLRTFVQLEASSWTRHRDWILSLDLFQPPPPPTT